MKQHQAPKLDILKEEWSQEMNISNIMTAIISLMVNPNADDAHDPEVAKIYRDHKVLYEAQTKEWTEKYA